jgi:hypothetical protein
VGNPGLVAGGVSVGAKPGVLTGVGETGRRGDGVTAGPGYGEEESGVAFVGEGAPVKVAPTIAVGDGIGVGETSGWAGALVSSAPGTG